MKNLRNILKNIWNWIWDLRTHPSVYVFILSCIPFNVAFIIYLYCEYVIHVYGTVIILLLLHLISLLGIILSIFGYLIEKKFKKLKLPDNKIIKYVYGFGLLQCIFPTILILFFVFGFVFGII